MDYRKMIEELLTHADAMQLRLIYIFVQNFL